MDFFDAQDRAKRNTGKLIALYLMAVIGIIISIYVVSLFLLTTQVDSGIPLWNPGWLLVVSLVVITTIAIGTMIRVSQLKKGGSAVAELLGGRKVNPASRDTNEQRLMNIVEEMSIASGLPVPDVYVLDNEENINAFAAGFGTNDAAVGVTRGALEQLTRDELQGVIAHEFSHIFNGDMRLNIRLIGVLNGILVIHIMGMVLMRSVMFSGGMRMGGGRNDKGGGNATIVIILMGLALVIIGYIGMIFGRIIQSAISRQREYLADAAAVQYTRNPDGLAGALTKIASKRKGAEIKDAHAMEMSHLFFASSFHSALDKLFATHPPVDKRVKAINPAFGTGDAKRKEKIRKKFEKEHVSAKAAGDGESSDKGFGGHAALTPEVILGTIGTMNSRNIQQAGKMLQDIPAGLRQAAHEPHSAEALIYALLFAADNIPESELPEWFIRESEASMAEETAQLLPLIMSGKREWYLPLAELALPSLRNMSKNQYTKFRSLLKKQAQMSEDMNLFAFALDKMVMHQLDTAFAKRKDQEIRHHHLKTLKKEIEVLLSALSHASGKDSQKAWEAALEPISKVKPDDLTLLSPEECRIDDLDRALDEIAAAANPVKRYLLSAVIHCVISDQNVTTEEKELVRAISEALDAPIPLGAVG
ncbi:MAG: M48 family metallopeptidase [Balneolaceae bacterium]|nr:M48 family metallopeptidase [Balneolaceae bacterium]